MSEFKKLIMSPQVVAALITSVVAISIAVYTSQNNAPAPMPTTTMMPTQVAEFDPTSTVVAEVTTRPTALFDATPSPVVANDASTANANITLLYDDVSFTIHNPSAETLSVAALRFQSGSGSWDATEWGVSLAEALPTNNCLRMRDVSSDEREPPVICNNLLGFQMVGGSALFWLETDSFSVMIDGETIATCSTDETSCPIFVPPSG